MRILKRIYYYLRFLFFGGNRYVNSAEMAAEPPGWWLWLTKNWKRLLVLVLLIGLAIFLLSLPKASSKKETSNQEAPAVSQQPSIPNRITVVDYCTLQDPDSGRTFIALDCLGQTIVENPGLSLLGILMFIAYTLSMIKTGWELHKWRSSSVGR